MSEWIETAIFSGWRGFDTAAFYPQRYKLEPSLTMLNGDTLRYDAIVDGARVVQLRNGEIIAESRWVKTDGKI